uniref:ABC transporter permease subunit n=1 Tax=Fervidicoccus fontis TaxID=683846 RepID=A0A7C1E935_9CREN
MLTAEVVRELLASTGLSLARMVTAYIISFVVAVFTGVAMAKNKYVEAVMLPLLDVLQSIPILGFLPAALIMFVRVLGPAVGAELSAVFLLFTSLVWNMIFGVYTSVKSLESSVDDLARVYRLPLLHRYMYIYLPVSRSSVAANSIVSWAGGWFFLTSAEVLSIGKTEYSLRGLGSFIIKTYAQGDQTAYAAGLTMLFAVILLSYLLLWNPIAMKYTQTKALVGFNRVYKELEKAVSRIRGLIWESLSSAYSVFRGRKRWLALAILFPVFLDVGGLYNIDPTTSWLSRSWVYIEEFLVNLPLTALRVYGVMAAGLALTIMLAYISHMMPRLSKAIVMLGEVLSSIPAMMWWPILLPALRGFPTGIMLFIYMQGSIWYVFFNTIVFGLTRVTRELDELSEIYGVRGRLYITKVFIPSIMPSIVAGSISSSGGAWNASIVAEHIRLGELNIDVGGVGSLLSRYAEMGDIYGVVLTSILMSVTIVAINKLLWARLVRRIGGTYVIG